MREAGSSSQYEPIQRQWAQDWSACLYVPLLCKLIGIRPTSAYKIQRFLDTVARASSESSRAVGNLPLTLSPVLPTLSAGKGLGKTGFVTLMKPLSAAAALGGEKPGLQKRTDALQLLYTGRKIPEYLQTHLRMRCIGDLKGQIRWFLTLSARSLPVFAEPNASPSVTSVCPLLCPPPLPSLPSLPPSLLLPPSIRSSDSTFNPGAPKQNIFRQSHRSLKCIL